MEDRRLALDRVAVIERQLGITPEKEKLKQRIRELEKLSGLSPTKQ